MGTALRLLHDSPAHPWVGYANAFALSVAFKRLRGVSPSRHQVTG